MISTNFLERGWKNLLCNKRSANTTSVKAQRYERTYLTMRIQFVGDIALTAEYSSGETSPELRRHVRELSAALPHADIRVGNWEAPAVTDTGPNLDKVLTIGADESAFILAEDLGLDVALLANNHALDYLEPGLSKTKALLNEMGVRTVGAGITLTQAREPLVIEGAGVSLAVLNYVDPGTNPWAPASGGGFLNTATPERILAETAAYAAQGHVVTVCVHWGIDFVRRPSPEHRRLGRAIVEAGALIVVGSHTHCLQGYERQGNGVIFYGLGNFLAGSIYPWPRFCEPTAAITCEIVGGNLMNVEITPLVLKDERLRLDPENRAGRAFRGLNRELTLGEKAYQRLWAVTMAHNLFIQRPIHLLQRTKNPLEALHTIRLRHLREYAGLLRTLISKR